MDKEKTGFIRFFSEELNAGTKEIILVGDEFHHLKNVLRLPAGTQVGLFNGAGQLATARVAEIKKNSCKLTIVSVREDLSSESELKIILLQAVLKGTKNEAVLRSATALGVTQIRFFTTGRTQGNRKDAQRPKKRQKLRKVVIEACKQCGRTLLPVVSGPTSLKATLESLAQEEENSLKIALFEAETETALAQRLRAHKTGETVILLTGPEGGFSDDDIGLVRRFGFGTTALGPRRLRSETASAVALAAVQYALGDIGS